MSTSDLYLTWEDVHRDARALGQKLKGLQDWKGVVGITRGGMVPACIVAWEVGVKLIDTLGIVSYDFKDQDKADIVKKPDLENGGEGWLIIDDLVDSGQTFRVARELFPNACLACVYAKPAGEETTDHFITAVAQETWIHLPWELDGVE